MTLILSWVESANSADTFFPLNNLPYGVFSTEGTDPRCGVAIGDMILDLAAVEQAGLIVVTDDPLFDVPFWNGVMELGSDVWAMLRTRLTQLLEQNALDRDRLEGFLVRQADAELHMPFVVSEFTDFYASKHHAMNVGTMFRGAENALPPNWLHIPIGYNGRASSVVVSGTEIVRPNGQTKAPDDEMPVFGPCKRLDFELEVGAIVGGSNPLGTPISVQQADDMIFGYVLLNDWSARDIQAWEYQPLGPFQAKAFATSISPWIVTKAALDPFRTSTPEREKELLPYLREPGPMLYDIDLSITIAPDGGPASTIARTSYSMMYYSAAQLLTHHASSGCAMQTGDLIGSGTISGPEKSERGALLEIAWGGKNPITLDSGETRSFIEDGDTIALHGVANGLGYKVGFGRCTGTIIPAKNFPNDE